jgi:hypothetical protein
MSKLARYILFFLVGSLLGLAYLLTQRPDLLTFPRRESLLDSGSLWTAEETFPELIEQENPKISILFGGDVMLDRHVRTMAERTGYDSLLTPELKQLLLDHDLVLVNLEGPITLNQSVSVGSTPGATNNFIFTFDPEVTNFLTDNNMSLVNLGNNHMTDFGVQGIASTLDFLSQAGIQHFGWVAANQEMEQYNRESLVMEVNDFILGFVNFNQFSNQPFSSAVLAVKEMRDQVDYLIVYTHWGTEYVPEPNAVIKAQAHQLVDAGADLIIGTHPHVIQTIEDYQGKRIYYSLGNFIFDQYFSPEVRRGQLVQLSLEKQPAQEDLEQPQIAASFKEFEVLMTSNQPVELIKSARQSDEETSAEDQTLKELINPTEPEADSDSGLLNP